MDLIQTLLVGAYVFTAGSYAFAWAAWRALSRLAERVAGLAVQVENHTKHAIEDLQRRVGDLENR